MSALELMRVMRLRKAVWISSLVLVLAEAPQGVAAQSSSGPDSFSRFAGQKTQFNSETVLGTSSIIDVRSIGFRNWSDELSNPPKTPTRFGRLFLGNRLRGSDGQYYVTGIEIDGPIIGAGPTTASSVKVKQYCRAGSDTRLKDRGYALRTALQYQGRVSVVSLGRYSYPSACRLQGGPGCAGPSVSWWECKVGAYWHNHPESLRNVHPSTWTEEFSMPPVQPGWTIESAEHGVFENKVDDPLWDDVKHVGFGYFVDATLRENLRNYFSVTNPLDHCNGCYASTSSGFWENGDNSQPWVGATTQIDPPYQAHAPSGGGSGLHLCRGAARNTPCICQAIANSGMQLNVRTDAEFDPDYGSMDVMGSLRTPSDPQEREEFTQVQLLNIGPMPSVAQYSQPFTVRYNCHALSFFAASFQNFRWEQFAEPSSSMCGGQWAELGPPTLSVPGDVVVWLDATGLGIHSATITGGSWGAYTYRSKNGWGPEYANATELFLDRVYHSRRKAYYRR